MCSSDLKKQPGPPPGGPGGARGPGGPSGPGGEQARTQKGINGSTVDLPFGLDSARTPVLGSYASGEQRPASLTTQWYKLDLAAVQQDSAYRVLVLTVAGRIAARADDGRDIEGQQLRLEFAHRADDGTVRALGDLTPPNIGGAPVWRNLPIALDRIPADTNAIRLVARTDGLSDKGWLAVTPPRLPKLSTLNAVIGKNDPVLADFQVGLAFPCQRPFQHRDGVAELPSWRIQPDKLNAQVSTPWQGLTGGGPLGWIDLLLQPRTVPAYLANDWTRDWGELQQYQFVADAKAPQANLTVEVENRWGWTEEEPIRTG
ncbi:arabinosyltransferase C-terminal domain-containing protein [Nocardia sp. NPDC005978]|uniref:arabinosyltransferase C-terminal domain-containing protein n=1 Tax=Nocardia sp. NPDC005978 TaxID=3156725 RepID=UPI0033B368C3